MAKILKLRMLSDEVENFVRNYEVPEDIDLKELHFFICGELEFDPTNFSSFFSSNEHWEKLQEYTLDDMEDDNDGVVPLPMEGTFLKEIIASGASRLIFMFDIFAARSMFIEIRGVGEPDSAERYPRLASGAGDPPSQTNSESILSEESPFDDMMSEFAEYEGQDDDSASDEM